MRKKRGTKVNALARGKMADELMEAYVAWRQACAAVEDAHRRWGGAHGQEGAQAYERCVAAIDEEGRAAAWYAAVTRQVDEAIEAQEAEGARAGSAAGQAGSP